MKFLIAILAILWVGNAVAGEHAPKPPNIVLFVADGLRPSSVNAATAPAFTALKAEGVEFANPHSLFPTVSLTNAAGMATGAQPGDTGVYGNTILTGSPIRTAGGSATPYLEDDPTLMELGAVLGGRVLNRGTIFTAALEAGYAVAAIGKAGPVLLMLGASDLKQVLAMDDSTGHAGGLPLSEDMTAALHHAGLPSETPPGGAARDRGDFQTPGTKTPNSVQQRYYLDVITKVLLPRFKASGRPFLLMLWSRDPGSAQQRQGDSLQSLLPGINGPTSAAAVENADTNLASLRRALKSLDLEENTDILAVSDVGFSTISRQSQTSWAATQNYADVHPGFLPPGYLAIDLAHSMRLSLRDPDHNDTLVDATRGAHPVRSNGFIGNDPGSPEIIVAEEGGSDLIYLPRNDARKWAKDIVDFLLATDYVGGIFVDKRLGRPPGTLSIDILNFDGRGKTPRPAIAVSFKSFSTGCADAVTCAAVVADTTYQQGHGVRGSLSRADTMNFMAAVGPSFRRRYIDQAPASTADIGMTIFHLLGRSAAASTGRRSRVLSEALVGGTEPAYLRKELRGLPTKDGMLGVLRYQEVGGIRYLDAAGFPSRTVGLDGK